MKFLAILFICTHLLIALSIYPFTAQQKSALESIVRNVDPNINIGIYVLSPKDPKITYTQNIDRLFTPASCAKLFTAAAALHILGPKFFYKTSFVTDGQKKRNILHGNLYLKASGDPSFKRRDLEKMVIRLKASGITAIKGDVCIDFSIFEDCPAHYFGRGFCMDDRGQLWNSPITSFIIDNNHIRNSDGKLIPLVDPHQSTRLIMKNILEKCNVTYSGIIRIASVPNKKTQVIVQSQSKPLKDLIVHMLKVSDNLYANAIFKLLGAHESKMPGTWENGTQAVKKFLQKYIGIHPETLVLEDGAGLSRYNLITPRHVVQLLTWIYNQPRLFDLFSKSLAISGKDGTLKNRMTHYPGIIKAKTGVMGGVSSLSGYLCLENCPPLIFSILINNVIQSRSQQDEAGKKRHINYKIDLEDKLCTYLIACAKDLI